MNRWGHGAAHRHSLGTLGVIFGWQASPVPEHRQPSTRQEIAPVMIGISGGLTGGATATIYGDSVSLLSV